MKQDTRISTYVSKISQFLGNKQYKKIVLQLNKKLLPLSFDLTFAIKKQFPQRQFYVLYDSLKQPCCTDTLGAQHVNYDSLIHFGHACFSIPHQPNHYYIFEESKPESQLKIKQFLSNKDLEKSITQNNIGYLLVDQPYYQFVKEQVDISHLNLELLKLSYDSHEDDEYLFFGYNAKNLSKDLKNILVICEEPKQQTQQMSFIQKISFSLKSLKEKVGQRLFKMGENQSQITQIKANTMKKLMQRYSIASQLDQSNIFGILVSNTAASFVHQTVARCQQILKAHKKKCFLFMMNNLNEVKLGNFPQIDVYVVVSCFNHSLFSVKDFHRLVVTPTDLQIAFQKRNFDQYGFDLKAQATLEHHIEKKLNIQSKEESQSQEIQKAHSQQIVLQNKIQTLAYYQGRQFKGLNFSDKKEIKKLTKGKIGLAQQYTNLQ